MKIEKKLKDEIKQFCVLNDIEDIDKFILDALQIGFNVEKYGNAPWQQEVEKIVEKEVIKEVPVEKIVEKEVIKEITVEKEVFITDDEEVDKLGKEVNILRDEIKNKETDIFNNAKNMKLLNNEIESKKEEITNLSDKLKKVNEEMVSIKKERGDMDIYGDGKGGFWGSNLKDKK